jgi:hypothetical protein
MIQLKLWSSAANRAEIFTRDVSLHDHSSLKFSAQKTYSKWKIISEGEPFMSLIFHEQLENKAHIAFTSKLMTNEMMMRLTTSSASREWRSRATPTND